MEHSRGSKAKATLKILLYMSILVCSSFFILLFSFGPNATGTEQSFKLKEETVKEAKPKKESNKQSEKQTSTLETSEPTSTNQEKEANTEKVPIPNQPSKQEETEEANPEINTKIPSKELEKEKEVSEKEKVVVQQPPPVRETTTPDQKRQEKTPIYLTFDDGPHEISSDLLHLLEQYNVKATFFMLNNNMLRFPDAVKQMVNNGHSVGLHGVTHDKAKFYQSATSVVNEMDTARQTLVSLTGVDSKLIRTPFGSAPNMTADYKNAVSNKGYKMWDWNIDSRDWYYKDHRYVDTVIEQLTKLITNNNGDPIVILLHEKPETLALLPSLLNYLNSQGFEYKAIDETMTPIHLK